MLVGKNFACVKIAGRANFMSSPDFKTLLRELNQKGYSRFIMDLSECVLMDSTFLGVLAGFGLMTKPGGVPGKCDIELANPNTRVSELLENLGVLPLFKVTTGPVQLPEDARACTPRTGQPHARGNHPHQPGGAPNAHGRQPGQRRPLQGCDAVSGRGFEEPRKKFLNRFSRISGWQLFAAYA